MESTNTGLGRDQYEILVSSVRRIEDSLASIDRDLEHDRQDMQDFKIRLATLENEFRELRKSVNQSSDKVRDKVADVVTPMQEEVTGAVTDLKEAVEKKRVLSFNPKKGFFAKLFKK